MISKKIGSLLILIGTAIGAGMLALPMVSAQAGLLPSIGLLLVIWAIMTAMGLIVLEINLAFPAHQNTFNTMAKATLGFGGQFIAWLGSLLLLYALTAAYIDGNASLITEALSNYPSWHTTNKLNAIVFTLIFGGAVFWSTRAVDIFNRGLISIKGLTLLIMLAILLPHIDVAQLYKQPTEAKYLLAAAPIFVTAFGFHTAIPSISNYLNRDAKALKKIVFWAATIPVILYCLWLTCTLGIIPLTGENSFNSLANDQGSVGEFVGVLTAIVHNKWVTLGVNGFSNIAMTTSFLGVSLGLFDFLADGFKRSDKRLGRLQTALLTFVPPLLFAIYYPHGFIAALSYASLCVIVLLIILPILMVYRMRRSSQLTSLYRVPGGNILLLIILLAGISLLYLSF